MTTFKPYRKLPVGIGKRFELFDNGYGEQASANEFIYVMSVDDKVVGCVFGRVEDIKMDKECNITTVIHINKIEVKKEERGKGYGKAMVEFVVSKYKPLEIRLFPLDEAIKFWRHLGFKGNDDIILHKRIKQ